MASLASTTVLGMVSRRGLLRTIVPAAAYHMRSLHTTRAAFRAEATATPPINPIDVKAAHKTFDQGSAIESTHFQTDATPSHMKDYTMPHPVWSPDECVNISITHREPKGIADRLAYYAVQFCRTSFDKITFYNHETMTEDKWLTRIVFLETVAGVPGMVAAGIRHLHSLGWLRRDHGWIHTLLEEAENERMHLLTAMQLKKAGLVLRASIITTQAVFVTGFTIAYLTSPRFCHRFVGYLEEEAVKTYTHCLAQIDAGKVWKDTPAPLIGRVYWKLGEKGTMRDLIAQIRADEAHHRSVNHAFSDLSMIAKKGGVAVNPYGPGR